ncbi:hypothetical protein DFH08DRAFT_820312 [Mycena albidolilacea]|uniref:Uncharacterized protein n=1 Tax=Mycena albidolilacea TaxID=1033008 RepID=A0AAD6ZDI3_9AGAR|nr:hypothetical protein DFH08DRAFT_820312 [Mycena albidolilacea]
MSHGQKSTKIFYCSGNGHIWEVSRTLVTQVDSWSHGLQQCVLDGICVPGRSGPNLAERCRAVPEVPRLTFTAVSRLQTVLSMQYDGRKWSVSTFTQSDVMPGTTLAAINDFNLRYKVTMQIVWWFSTETTITLSSVGSFDGNWVKDQYGIAAPEPRASIRLPGSRDSLGDHPYLRTNSHLAITLELATLVRPWLSHHISHISGESLGISPAVHNPMKRLHQRRSRDKRLAWPVTVHTGMGVSTEVEINLGFCVQQEQLRCHSVDFDNPEVEVVAPQGSGGTWKKNKGSKGDTRESTKACD